jgi:hypothetical protein
VFRLRAASLSFSPRISSDCVDSKIRPLLLFFDSWLDIVSVDPVSCDIMKPRSRNTKSASINSSRWLAYATAGAASAFAGANSADATIHYSGIVRIYSGSELRTTSFRIPLDQAGDSFRMRRYISIFTSSAFDHFGVQGLADAGFAGFYCPERRRIASMSKLGRGAFISARPFLGRQSGLIYSNFTCGGQFAQGEVGFVGFKFNNGSGDQYGWARIKMGRLRGDFWLVDYAYADPGESIKAGQTSSNEMVSEGGNDMVPAEGSLGWLALGAMGLLAWRKRRL